MSGIYKIQSKVKSNKIINMNLLLAIFLLLEAVFEGLRTGGHLLAAEIMEAGWLAAVTYGLYSFINGHGFNYKPILKAIIGYVLLRFALFDLIWNLSAGQDWNFYGTTKLYDTVMNSLGGFGWFLKFCSFVWGIAWLTKWGNNTSI